jgi:hypothetical protein
MHEVHRMAVACAVRRDDASGRRPREAARRAMHWRDERPGDGVELRSAAVMPMRNIDVEMKASGIV